MILIHRKLARGLIRLSLVLGAAVSQSVAGQTAGPAQPPPPVRERIVAEALKNVHPIAFDGTRFSGPGWDLIVREGRASEFFLLGEEHGTAEIPVLTGALFEALAPAGYDKLVIELSPPIADELDQAARGGLDGIRAYYNLHPPGPAFYSWAPEAALLAKVRSLVPPSQQAIWGIDYEVLGDRQLLAALHERAPAAARPAVARVQQTSAAEWSKMRAGGEISGLFPFSADAQVIRDLRPLWPSPDPRSKIILDTLEATLEINALFKTSGWASNQRRAEFNRAQFLRLITEQQSKGRTTKALIKMGSTHTMRGVSWTGVFDVGTLASEMATIRGGRSFLLLVGGGARGRVGGIGPQLRWMRAMSRCSAHRSSSASSWTSSRRPDWCWSTCAR